MYIPIYIYDKCCRLVYSNKLFAIFVHWVFQGMLYADKTEKIFKISSDILLTTFLTVLFSHAIANYISIQNYLLFFFVVSHTLNFVFNAQFNVVVRHFGRSSDHIYLSKYIGMFVSRTSNEPSIQSAAIYGSFSRGEAKDSSDVDIRLIRNPGVVNGLRACLFGLTERSRALFNRFPLDLYVVDNISHLSKLRSDEIPIILYDPMNMLHDHYKIVRV